MTRASKAAAVWEALARSVPLAGLGCMGLAAFAPLAASAGPAEVGITFSLDAERTTSAGVYAADGTLVRTLWRGERMAAGVHTRTWDQRSDRGVDAAEGEYTVRVVHHDVRYVWEGVVGNSSSLARSVAPHRAYLVPHSLAMGNNGRMHWALGYNEHQNGLQGFDLASPLVSRSAVRLVDPFIAAAMVATDGERLYWVNLGGMAKGSFVAAFDLATGEQFAFAQGMPRCLNYRPDGTTCYPAQHYQRVLEARSAAQNPPTGIAVQRQGRILAVAYGADNAVLLFDKVSGAALRTLRLPLNAKASNQIAMTPKGDLWVLGSNGAVRYSHLSGSAAAVASIAALSKPLAIAVDPKDEDSVWIADGGASQQLKRFSGQGALRQTVGRRGGYAGTTEVSDDRLCFHLAPALEQTAVAVDDTGAVWVVDSCNNRTLKVGRDGQVADEIAYLPGSYVSSVDSGNPARVFANYLEFAVDHSKPLSEPGAWRLVRNWLHGVPASARDDNSENRAWGGLRTVQTLSNGRTYALHGVYGPGFKPSLVELTASGGVRLIRWLPPLADGETPLVLYENGDLGYARTDRMRQSVLRLRLDRFDATGDPVWSSVPVVIASAPLGKGAPYHRIGTFSGIQGPRFPTTQTGQVVFFDQSVGPEPGFKLGAVKLGASTWSWQASPSGPLDGLGRFQTRQDDPEIQYGGNVVLALGRTILYGYHGEFYTDLGNRRVGQANQFMHFRDDGLFIGQFGVPSTRSTSPVQPGLSGNAFSLSLVRVDGRTYLYHNDESSHGGIHRWRIDGIDELRDMVGSVNLGSTVVLR